ncbi:MAG: hypothetical protein GY830_05930 [Bacteroidetes bacterium]|nr:hypothetical protein [Bacteroidota bacterium]
MYKKNLVYIIFILSLIINVCNNNELKKIKQKKTSNGMINKTFKYIKKVTPLILGLEMIKKGVNPVFSESYTLEYPTNQWSQECIDWYQDSSGSDSSEIKEDCCEMLLKRGPTISSPTKYKPSTEMPSIKPTSNIPTNSPSEPTLEPTLYPTNDPTSDPTNDPTLDPTNDPTSDPTNDPTSNPTKAPTLICNPSFSDIFTIKCDIVSKCAQDPNNTQFPVALLWGGPFCTDCNCDPFYEDEFISARCNSSSCFLSTVVSGCSVVMQCDCTITENPTNDPTSNPTMEPTIPVNCIAPPSNVEDRVGAILDECEANPNLSQFSVSSFWGNSSCTNCTCDPFFENANISKRCTQNSCGLIDPGFREGCFIRMECNCTIARRRLLSIEENIIITDADYKKAYQKCINKNKSENLDGGQIAGITLGVIIGSVLLCFIILIILMNLYFLKSSFRNSYIDIEQTLELAEERS